MSVSVQTNSLLPRRLGGGKDPDLIQEYRVLRDTLSRFVRSFKRYSFAVMLTSHGLLASGETSSPWKHPCGF